MNIKKGFIITLTTVTLLGSAIYTTNSVMADGKSGNRNGWGMHGQMGMGQGGMMGQGQMGMGQGGMMGHSQFLMDSMVKARVETLALISGMSEESIEELLQEKTMPLVMEELKIDRQQFHASMQSKITWVIEQGVKDGKISEEQKELMANHMRMGNQTMEEGALGKQGMGADHMRGYRMGSKHMMWNSTQNENTPEQ